MEKTLRLDPLEQVARIQKLAQKPSLAVVMMESRLLKGNLKSEGVRCQTARNLCLDVAPMERVLRKAMVSSIARNHVRKQSIHL
jgi:hypothetical protein